ncbi:MAG: EAL domain-containing protein [Zoogloeaceae bacterium]|jgi:diguanylate cyclase (GGDEF)-like protein|nr:EAL domain-containing protein [Zoogloeaceae bacterium]
MNLWRKLVEIWLRLSVRVRLILLFVGIKVVPLVLLLWVAWSQTQETAKTLDRRIEELVNTANQEIHSVGDMTIDDAVNALDARAREEIERQTTDTARQIADFLYDRDMDIAYAGSLPPSEKHYRAFVERQRRNLTRHDSWRLNAARTDWEPETPLAEDPSHAEPGSRDNATNFHYRRPVFFKTENLPLYLEISFVGLDGREQIKVTTSPRMNPALKDVSQRKNTYAKAETYFAALKRLKPGEIYVSDVIGTYVGSQIIGKFTPQAAEGKGIPFEPEKHAYAGKENPVGKRFQGIVRWATPVLQEGRIIGWVTLALNHDHLMAFTDTIVPTEERYRDINDAFDGNYAFIWDYKGRSIVHPRHHSIVGYDENGEPAVPWLEDRVYEDWQKSGKGWREYMQDAPTFVDQLQSRKPAALLTEQGNVGLDCRYLNFAPQCTGWYNLANQGGSGSFLILWSGLWKLTTTAAIPYYTGQYNPAVAGNRRGFGIVTIGANVNDFHKAATVSKTRLDGIVKEVDDNMYAHGTSVRQTLQENMASTALHLVISTLLLIGIVIVIAIQMASFLSKKIGWLNSGFNRFRLGEKNFRFEVKYQDEITSLATTFNEMAEALNKNVAELKKEIVVRTQAEKELLDIKEHLELRIVERTQELSQTNRQLSEEIGTRRAAEEKAQYLAGHDPLTGLANRMLFNEQLQKAICQSLRSGQYGALLFFDLDRFKHVNDTLGHAVGDALLVHMARVLQERTRKSDMAARLGGDEFAIIMTEMAQPESAAILAQSILDKLKQPVMLGDHEMRVYSSIGIATFHRAQADNNPEDIIRNADLAMYQAKTGGGACYCFFEKSIQEKLAAHRQMETELSEALKQRQFLTYFQPLYHTTEHKVLYLEVLARWAHPERGLLFPNAFMDVATHSGIITDIDGQILDMACRQARAWLDEGLSFGRVSVNILPRYLEKPDFASNVQATLTACRLSAEYLAFEIAEYALLQSSAQSSATLNTLRDMGVVILVDELDVQRSALQKLLEYPIDAIKINRAFTAHIGEAKTDAMISAIAAIARAINLRIIAEGVESEAQWAFFQALRCEIIQGYRHAKPMTAENTRRYLLAHHAK